MQDGAGVDARGQLLVVDEHPVAAQHVWHEVVGEDREKVEVVELGDAGKRKVVGDDLRALVEVAVVEHGHTVGERVRQALGRALALRDEVERAALAEEASEQPQRLRVEAHQLKLRGLVEDGRDLARTDLAQPCGGGRTVPAHVVGEVPGDGEVAAERLAVGVALAQQRKPTGAEVDGVEREQVVGDIRGGALQVVALGGHDQIPPTPRPGVHLRRDVEVDAHVPRVRGDVDAAGAHLLGERHTRNGKDKRDAGPCGRPRIYAEWPWKIRTPSTCRSCWRA
jgi:hypothetical protein